jgi:hypothetical protein
MLYFGKEFRAPAYRAILATLRWFFACTHANRSRPMSNHQTCLDCGYQRVYRFTQSGIYMGRWRKPMPASTQPTWDYVREAAQPSVFNNPIDIAAARERNSADQYPATCAQHGLRLDHYGQCATCVAAREVSDALRRASCTEYRRVVDTAQRVTEKHIGQRCRKAAR